MPERIKPSTKFYAALGRDISVGFGLDPLVRNMLRGTEYQQNQVADNFLKQLFLPLTNQYSEVIKERRVIKNKIGQSVALAMCFVTDLSVDMALYTLPIVGFPTKLATNILSRRAVRLFAKVK